MRLIYINPWGGERSTLFDLWLRRLSRADRGNGKPAHRRAGLAGLCEQTIGRLVEPLIRTARVIEMTNQLSGQPVDVGPSEVIELRAITVENLSPDYNADVNTLAVEYIAFRRSLLA
jgi:hypothetical protein